jgi:hypothetical protein
MIMIMCTDSIITPVIKLGSLPDTHGQMELCDSTYLTRVKKAEYHGGIS